MNLRNDTFRAYRASYAHQQEHMFQVVVEQTDLCIICNQDLREPIFDHVHALRGHIMAYAQMHPTFLTSLVPLHVTSHQSTLVTAMLKAAQAMHVGPMAAVAGAIAQDVADTFGPECGDILVENGGDIYIRSAVPRTIGLLPDPTQAMTLGLSLQPEDFPCAICASSASIGHSLSLGQGDLVVTRARSGALADAAATRLCNELRTRKDLRKILEMADAFRAQGLLGVLAQCKGQIGIRGEMELIGLG
ncbi:UPF0280 family protein [Desulfoplanes formicivorans]|uniref:Thiamine biosynthesis protein ApbE n=1 Tax=Desulfoplanes formicivorans TaxID=1592317 RepID=A0A194AF80_9BACT|nr:UPF0280 family protein [Desulfoplanes formicivorans]GAU07439.1 thiamine biosynthesis protein ApbE [Desulfoplanes formicivorans]